MVGSTSTAGVVFGPIEPAPNEVPAVVTAPTGFPVAVPTPESEPVRMVYATRFPSDGKDDHVRHGESSAARGVLLRRPYSIPSSRGRAGRQFDRRTRLRKGQGGSVRRSRAERCTKSVVDKRE